MFGGGARRRRWKCEKPFGMECFGFLGETKYFHFPLFLLLLFYLKPHTVLICIIFEWTAMFIENITNEVGANLLNIKNIIVKAIRIELHFDHYIQTYNI